MTCPSQSSRFNHPDCIRWTVQTMKFLIVEPSPLPILIPLGLKYSPLDSSLEDENHQIYINIKISTSPSIQLKNLVQMSALLQLWILTLLSLPSSFQLNLCYICVLSPSFPYFLPSPFLTCSVIPPIPFAGKGPHLRWWLIHSLHRRYPSWGLSEFSSAVRQMPDLCTGYYYDCFYLEHLLFQ